MLPCFESLSLSRMWIDDDEVVIVTSSAWHFLGRDVGYHPIDSEVGVRMLESLSHDRILDMRVFYAQATRESQVYRMSDDEVRRQIIFGLRNHSIITVQKGAAGPVAPSATAVQRTLVKQVEKESRGKLSFRGRHYKLVADVDLARTPDRDSYEVVPYLDARAVLDGISKEEPALAGTLAKVWDKLTKDWRRPFTYPDGLILLKRIPIRAAAPKDTGPAITPSQMKALLEKAWIGVVVVDNFGRPWHGDVQLQLASGEDRVCSTDDNGEIHLDRICPGAVEAALPKLDRDAYQKA